MVERMAGKDESNGQGGDFLAAGSAAAKEGGVIQGTNQSEGGTTDGGEFLEKAEQFPGRRIGGLDVVILLETRKRSLIAAGDAKQPIGEDTLRVVDMAEDFLDGPLAGLITEVGLLFA